MFEMGESGFVKRCRGGSNHGNGWIKYTLLLESRSSSHVQIYLVEETKVPIMQSEKTTTDIYHLDWNVSSLLELLLGGMELINIYELACL